MCVLTKDTNISALCDVKKWIKVYKFSEVCAAKADVLNSADHYPYLLTAKHIKAWYHSV